MQRTPIRVVREAAKTLLEADEATLEAIWQSMALHYPMALNYPALMRAKQDVRMFLTHASLIEEDKA